MLDICLTGAHQILLHATVHKKTLHLARLVNLAMISKIAMARLAMVRNRDFEAIAMVNQIKTIPLYRRKIRGLL